MKTYTAMAAALHAYNCRVIFALLGDANMLYISEFVERHQGRLVNAAHESGVIAMADGYSRVLGEVAFASVTHGPGFTNCLTALTEAARARTPLVVLTGTASSARGALQTIDISALATNVGAGYEIVAQPQGVAESVAIAVTRATLERRPIVLDLPADLLLADIGQQPDHIDRLTTPTLSACDQAALDDALGLVLSADRPTILAGRGATSARARKALSQLSYAFGAPLTTTLLAKDSFHGHPSNLGVCGTISSSLALDALRASDCLISFGASLNRFTTDQGNLTAGKTLIQCCLERPDFGSYVIPTLALVGDAALVAEQMLERLNSGGHEPRPIWGNLGDRIGAFNPRDDFRSAGNGLDPREVSLTLNQLLPPQKTLITDCGHFQFAPWKYLSAEPGYFHHTVNFGSVGLGLPFAVGASLGRPNVPTVVCVGDGGLMMSLEALNTAARSGAHLLVVVFNNRGYSAEYHKLAREGLPTKLSGIQWPDLAGIARSLGCRATTATALDDLADIPRLAELEGPTVIDVHVDPTVDLY